jgi:hypothetical protein
MGYTTDFNGEFRLKEPLTREQEEYLTAFADTRRMERNPTIAAKLPDPLRLAVGLPIGDEGGYFVGSSANHGQNNDASVVDHNAPPSDQPGLWCQWRPSGGADAIVWDEGEKFYNYIEWIEYIVENFLKPWGHVLNGSVEWQGEDSDDFGQIVITNNNVKIRRGKKTFVEEE